MLGYVFHKIKLKYLFILLLILFLIIYLILFNKSIDYNKLPVILYWTPFIPQNKEVITCDNNYKCLLTRNRDYTNLTDVFLFYGSNLNVSDLPLPKTKPWALFHEESPRNVDIFLNKKVFQLFEIAATFSRFSDMPLTFQYLENLNSITDIEYFIDIKKKNEFLNSISPVLYLQSDCDTPNNRDSYINELMKFIKIDSFGTCLNNNQFALDLSEIDSMDLFNDSLLKFIAKYKFVIAFENANCNDYITEKLWRPLMVGSIPIYFGSPTIEDWLPNNKSAILVKNYESPQKLAEFIHKLNENNDMYNEYLKHKLLGEIENKKLKNIMSRGAFGHETNKDHSISAFECFVCRRIHEKNLELNRKDNIYDCATPVNNNPWTYFWEKGQCKGETLYNFVHQRKKGSFIDNC